MNKIIQDFFSTEMTEEVALTAAFTCVLECLDDSINVKQENLDGLAQSLKQVPQLEHLTLCH